MTVQIQRKSAAPSPQGAPLHDMPDSRHRNARTVTILAQADSRALRVTLQVSFLLTTLMSIGAIASADSVLTGLAVIPAFALTLFPVSNFIFILWIFLNPRARRTLAGEVLVNTPSYANSPLCERPGPEDLDCSVTVQVPVYTESFSAIRETLEHALAAVEAYNAISPSGANLIVSDDALMVWADNDLSGLLSAAEGKPREEWNELEALIIERVDFYRRNGIAFVARPKPIAGCESSQRPGRFKKGGNLNRTIRLAEAVAKKRERADVGSDAALTLCLEDPAFDAMHAEGTIELGDIILMLDKDSITPRDALVLTVPEFTRDERLAYTQHKTVATNARESYFTGVMGLFTRLVFDLVFPAKALQGWMPPFMGHNGFVRRSVLAASGYWSEDRVGEDLNFTLWATASGFRGKYIAYTGQSFGEQVTRTYAEEAGKYQRYGFSILELILYPVAAWPRRGLFTERFLYYIRSPALAWEHKTDLMVIYPFFYINLALIPVMTLFIPFLGINVLIYGLIFVLSLAPPLLLAGGDESAGRGDLPKRLIQFQALGFMFISFGFYILKGFTTFLSASDKARFGVTSVEALDDSQGLRERLSRLSPQFVLAVITLGLVSLTFSAAWRLGELEWVHLLASAPVLISVAIVPFAMSPALLKGLRRAEDDA